MSVSANQAGPFLGRTSGQTTTATAADRLFLAVNQYLEVVTTYGDPQEAAQELGLVWDKFFASATVGEKESLCCRILEISPRPTLDVLVQATLEGAQVCDPRDIASRVYLTMNCAEIPGEDLGALISEFCTTLTSRAGLAEANITTADRLERANAVVRELLWTVSAEKIPLLLQVEPEKVQLAWCLAQFSDFFSAVAVYESVYAPDDLRQIVIEYLKGVDPTAEVVERILHSLPLQDVDGTESMHEYLQKVCGKKLPRALAPTTVSNVGAGISVAEPANFPPSPLNLDDIDDGAPLADLDSNGELPGAPTHAGSILRYC